MNDKEKEEYDKLMVREIEHHVLHRFLVDGIVFGQMFLTIEWSNGKREKVSTLCLEQAYDRALEKKRDAIAEEILELRQWNMSPKEIAEMLLRIKPLLVRYILTRHKEVNLWIRELTKDG